MSNKKTGNKTERNVFIPKCFIVLAFIVQVIRIAGTGCMIYVIYDTLIVEKKTLGAAFDRPLETYMPSNDDDEKEENETTLTTTESEFFKMVRERFINVEDEDASEDYSSDLKWRDVLLLCIPLVEVVTASVLMYLITNPLSPSLPGKQWMGWLIRMRVFWMRLIGWTLTAVTYCVINHLHRKYMYDNVYDLSVKNDYLDSPIIIAAMAFTVVEYFVLGLLQSAMKIWCFDFVFININLSLSHTSKFWRKLSSFCYYLTTFAFALRNFSMSLYFGLLCIYVDAENNSVVTVKSKYSSILLVLQVYLAFIRSKLYGFFMKDFLAIFLMEEDDEVFEKVRQREEERIKKSKEERHSLV